MSPKSPTMSRRAALLTTMGCVSTLSGCNSASLSFSDGSKKDKAKEYKPLNSPWPTAGATSRRTGIASNARLPPADAKATPLMKRDDPASGGIRMAPVVADGTAYATAATGHVIARGKHEWTVSVDGQAGLTPTIADGMVYEPTTSGILALDPRTGNEQWRTENKAVSRDIGDAVPTAANGSVFLGTEDVSALDEETGKEQWVGKYRTSTTTWGIATTGKRTVAIAAFDGNKGTLACFGSDGTREWTTSVKVSSKPPGPTIADGTVYAPTDAGTLYAVNMEDGSVQWKATIDDGVNTGLAVDNGTVFVPGGSDGTLRAIDAGDGTTRWTQHVGHAAAPAVVGKQLLVSGTAISGPKSDVGFAVLDPTTGERRRTYTANTAGPFAVGDGAIYVYHANDSSLWAIR